MESVIRTWASHAVEVQKLTAYLSLHRQELNQKISSSPIQSYSGRRGSMVVDAICSRRRNYESRVLPMVAIWETQNPAQNLESLAYEKIPAREMGLMVGEEQTLQEVAENLLLFGKAAGTSTDDETCHLWATQVESIRYVHDIDEVVGAVKGVGPALFSYLRILSGVDAIKPDVRVREKLRKHFGILAPKSDVALMHICEVYAEDLGISRTEFDQLMWEQFSGDSEKDLSLDDGEGMLINFPGTTGWRRL